VQELETSSDTSLHTLDELHIMLKRFMGLQYNDDEDEEVDSDGQIPVYCKRYLKYNIRSAH
jgi:hypothetical protein